MVVEGPWKYIRNPVAAPEGVEGSPLGVRRPAVADEELFDLEGDPAERHNLAEHHPEILEAMRARSEAHRAAMASRAALLGKFNSSGVILLGGDIPPEIKKIDQMKRILLARGKKDKFYSSIRWKNDLVRVKKSRIESFICEFNGGHEGHKDYCEAAGKFLEYYI